MAWYYVCGHVFYPAIKFSIPFLIHVSESLQEEPKEESDDDMGLGAAITWIV